MKMNKYNFLSIVLLATVSCVFSAEQNYRGNREAFVSPNGFSYPPIPYQIVMPQSFHPALPSSIPLLQNPATGEIFPMNGMILPPVNPEIMELRAEVNRLNYCVASLVNEQQHHRAFFANAFQPTISPFFPHQRLESNPAVLPVPFTQNLESLSQPEIEEAPATSFEVTLATSKEETQTPFFEVTFMSESVLTEEEPAKVVEVKKAVTVEPVTMQEATPTQTPDFPISYAEVAKAGILTVTSDTEEQEDVGTSKTPSAQKKKKKKKKNNTATPAPQKPSEKEEGKTAKLKEQQRQQKLEELFTAAQDKIAKEKRQQIEEARLLEMSLKNEASAEETGTVGTEKPTDKKRKAKKKKSSSKSASSAPSQESSTLEEEAAFQEAEQANKEARAQQATVEATQATATPDPRKTRSKELTEKLNAAKMRSKNGKNVAATIIVTKQEESTLSETAATAVPKKSDFVTNSEKSMCPEAWKKMYTGTLILRKANSLEQKDFVHRMRFLLEEPCIQEHPFLFLGNVELISLGFHPDVPSCTQTKPHTGEKCSCGIVQIHCDVYQKVCKARGETEDPLVEKILTKTLMRLAGNPLQEEEEKASTPIAKINSLFETLFKTRETNDTPLFVYTAEKIFSAVENTRVKYAADGDETHAQLNAQEVILININAHPQFSVCEILEPHQNKNCSCEKIVELTADKMNIKCLYYFILQIVYGRGITQDVPAAKILLKALAQRSTELATKLREDHPVFADVTFDLEDVD